MDEIAVPATEVSIETPADLTDEQLLDAMVFQTLVDGLTKPRALALAERMGRPQDRFRMQYILDRAEFQTKLFRARRDLAAYTTDQIKLWLPSLAKQMFALAQDRSDRRTQFAALKDLMDRGGMGAAQKVSLTTPSAYQQAIADLIEPMTTPDSPTSEEGPAS